MGGCRVPSGREAYAMTETPAKREPTPQGPAQSALGRASPCYVQAALEARRAHGRRSRRHAAVTACLGLIAGVGLAACGSGPRQDENEPKGNFQVDVLDATFPTKQKLAKRSDLVIKVKNSGDEEIPNIALTVAGFDERRDNPDLADPNRPVFVINGVPKQIGGFPESKDAAPPGCDTAYVNTWACGKLGVGKVKSFKWTVTAVRAGPYKIRYTVAAGLNGKAKAVDANGVTPKGTFAGTISDTPPQTRVADDGHTIVSGTR
jgi:hypothetical protein